MKWDLVVKGGSVVDGTGMRAFTADLAVRDGRIARIGRVSEPAAREIDSFMRVPPRSLAPACKQARAPSTPSLTHEAWMFVISG